MKKKQELYYLNLFKKHYVNFPEGRIIEFESPDFLIKYYKKIIGIEFSKVFQSNNGSRLNYQAKDSIQNDIIKIIKELLVKNNLMTYEVHLLITVHNPLIKKERKKIAEKIFLIIKNNLPSPNKYIRIHNDFNNINMFPEQISHISIINIPKLKTPFVTDAKFGWVQKDMIDEISAIINKKNSKINLYQKNCEEIWLIIYTDSLGSGSFFDPSTETLNYAYNSKFNKVFFLNSFDSNIYELKTKKEIDYAAPI